MGSKSTEDAGLMDMPTISETVLYRPGDGGLSPLLVVQVRGLLLSGHVFYAQDGPAYVRGIPYGTGPGCWQWRVKTKQA